MVTTIHRFDCIVIRLRPPSLHDAEFSVFLYDVDD